jgi:hypothetical protein
MPKAKERWSAEKDVQAGRVGDSSSNKELEPGRHTFFTGASLQNSE